MLENGTYELLQQRLQNSGKELQKSLDQLNTLRKDIFGSIEIGLIASERLMTDNNCIARDMIPIGETFLFGYNVQLGLRKEMALSDVFSVYSYDNASHSFKNEALSLIEDKQFVKDFSELYQYQKDTKFAQFFKAGNNLYMLFQLSDRVGDIKAFKWVISGNVLKYVDARSEHEVVFPSQHDFEWKRTTRNDFKEGEHPHVSILDRVFVETVGGDLTIKIEDNTLDGEGILAEEVNEKDQRLEDGEIHYADLGNIILLKILPYREKEWRFFVYNDKLKTAIRVNAISNACILLPEEQGIVVSNGYYLQNGEYKLFEQEEHDWIFKKKIVAPNGEDYLFVFYQRDTGEYILLSYNVIEQSVQPPLKCNGYSLFPNGELVYFKADEEPRKVHNLQILQSPFVDADLVDTTTENEHYLVNLGNKEVVKAMAQLNGINVLCQKSDNYMGLYSDILQEASVVVDLFPWLGREDVGNLLAPIEEIKGTASAAIEEYEKVSRQRKNAEEQQKFFDEESLKITRQIDRGTYKDIRDYVQGLASLRALRGKAVSLKEVRYIQISPIEEKEETLKEHSLKLGERCIQFLLGENALTAFTTKIDELRNQLPKWEKTVDVEDAIEELTALGKELELLIETVSNLKIKDATQTAEIINNISQLFSSLNNVQAQAREKKNQLGKQEAEAEFTAQYRLLEQSVSSFLDISTTPEECDEYLSKLSAQVEELEGKFADFDDFAEQLEKKREEIATVFETKKIQLEEVRNKRVLRLRNSADRMIQSILAKAKKMEKEDQLIAYFSTDLLIEKLRETAKSLTDLGETSKGEEVVGSLKKAQKEAIRQLRDRNELNVDGPGFIRFGKHSFAVAQQELGATIIERKGNLFFHLTGTDFFEEVQDESLLSTKDVWTMSLPSESSEVYRGEYLAYQFLANQNASLIKEQDEESLLKEIQKYMGASLNDGYLKGVHDLDARKLVKVYAEMNSSLRTLCYDSVTRALAQIVWLKEIPKKEKEIIQEWANGFSLFSTLFEEKADPSSILKYITPHVEVMLQKLNLELETAIEEIGYCLMDMLTYGYFEISEKANFLVEEFKRLLLAQNVKEAFDQHISKLSGQWEKLLTFMEIGWSTLFKSSSFTEKEQEYTAYTLEASLLLLDTFKADRILSKVEFEQQIEGLLGDHRLINEGKYQFNFYNFTARLKKHISNSLPLFEQYIVQKREVLDSFKKEVKLSSFEPKVLSSFVRNRLINDVYLPLIGENLSKQIGAAGSKKRTDLMGLLLLISPPGYGKTTLMEYVANRLGLIFMKINGPSIGHQVLSLDPEEAPNATAREELEKLGLALEMGNNVMLYLDDIQHCNPEFLQKFISLCDGQRKIEGVYKENTKTYDLRGKRFCVIMAGNPYTESGDKFQIPDMLANRADTYNLGEVIGSTQTAFELSYIENCLTSNQIISQWTNYPKKDLYQLVSAIKNDELQNLELEINISTDEKEESIKIFRQLLYVQSVILKVNQAYVASAAQDDDYRIEPPFKLQGSYRNMNKLAEKLSPLMNEKELQELVVSHYENESQTLTSAAEENLLKFKELIEILTEADLDRWNEIKQTFRQKNNLKVLGDQSGEQTLTHLAEITSAIKELKKEVIYIVK